MSKTTTYAVYEQQTLTVARRIVGGLTEAAAHERRDREVERGGTEGALFVEVDCGETIDSEPPRLVGGFDRARDVTITEMFTKVPGEVGLKVEGYTTDDGRTLGFFLAISIPKRETIFVPYEGTWEGKRNEEVSKGVWEYLAHDAEDLLPNLKAEALLNMLGVLDAHQCSRCGKCGREFDADGNDVSGFTEDEAQAADSIEDEPVPAVFEHSKSDTFTN